VATVGGPFLRERTTAQGILVDKHPKWREDQLRGREPQPAGERRQMCEVKDIRKQIRRERSLNAHLTEVAREVWRAHRLHGSKSMMEESSAAKRMGILLEEALEVVRAVNDGDPVEHLREELVQLAAMAMTWLVALDE